MIQCYLEADLLPVRKCAFALNYYSGAIRIMAHTVNPHGIPFCEFFEIWGFLFWHKLFCNFYAALRYQKIHKILSTRRCFAGMLHTLVATPLLIGC
jgi:hypothetical protein